MSWRLAESLEKLREQINAAYPRRDKTSDGAIGDAAHATRSSDHNPWVKDGKLGVVTAIDIDEDLNGDGTLEDIVTAIRKSRDKRVKYIIYDRRITVQGSDLQRWKKYNGANAHQQHAHISVHSDKKLFDSTAEWDIGVPHDLQTAEPRPNPPEIQPETSQSGEHREQAVTPAAEAPFISSGQLSVASGQTEFIPEDKTADAPPPTGFLNKLKTHLAAIFAFVGGGAGLKEWLDIRFTPETVQLLTVAIPTVLGLGFLGFLTWYIAEKIVGFKTLKLQSEINTDPKRHNLKINPQ